MKSEYTLGMKMGVLLAYFLIYFVWGSTYFFIGLALKDFPPFLLGAVRFLAAAIILLMLCSLRGECVFSAKLVKSSAVSGIVLLFIDMAVIMLAQSYVTSSLVAIVASSTAIWIMALDVPMWGVNFKNPCKVVGIIAGFLGVAMLFIEQLFSSFSASSKGEYGIAILIFGCISWALGTLYAKYKSSQTEGINAFAGGAWQMFFASIAFWICSIALGEIGDFDFKSASKTSYAALAYLIFFGSILAYSAYIWLLKLRPAAEVGTHAYVNPVVALLLGVFIGEERVSAIQIAGLAIILGSVAMATLAKPKKTFIENE